MADIATIDSAAGPLLPGETDKGTLRLHRAIMIGLAVALVNAPFVAYPVFVMKVLLRAVCARLQSAARLWRPSH